MKLNLFFYFWVASDGKMCYGLQGQMFYGKKDMVYSHLNL